VAGLRVVDTSVMPRVTSRGPAATAVMIGERAADLMQKDHPAPHRSQARGGPLQGGRG
jgi:choline dehydrogenase-like flavoprotein